MNSAKSEKTPMVTKHWFGQLVVRESIGDNRLW